MADNHPRDDRTDVTRNSGIPSPDPDTTRILAYNVRYDFGDVEPRSWNHRRDVVAETVADYEPDVVAFQEVWMEQLEELQARLPTFEWVTPDEGNEHAVLAYRADRYDCLTAGSKWLSGPETAPGVPGWDSDYQKRFVYARLADSVTDTAFVVFSVHLPVSGERAPRKAMEFIRETLTDVSRDEPAIVAGDFNTQPGESVYELGRQTREEYRDLAYASEKTITTYGPEITFTGFPNVDEEPMNIDHVLVSPAVAVERTATVIPDAETDSFKPSDHRPILADVRFES